MYLPNDIGARMTADAIRAERLAHRRRLVHRGRAIRNIPPRAAGLGGAMCRARAVVGTRAAAICVGAAILVGISLTGCESEAGIGPEAANERASAAWTARLVAQAEATRQSRMTQAWTARLDALADHVGAGRISPRASYAWTLRLNGLARHHAPD